MNSKFLILYIPPAKPFYPPIIIIELLKILKQHNIKYKFLDLNSDFYYDNYSNSNYWYNFKNHKILNTIEIENIWKIFDIKNKFLSNNYKNTIIKYDDIKICNEFSNDSISKCIANYKENLYYEFFVGKIKKLNLQNNIDIIIVNDSPRQIIPSIIFSKTFKNHYENNVVFFNSFLKYENELNFKWINKNFDEVYFGNIEKLLKTISLNYEKNIYFDNNYSVYENIEWEKYVSQTNVVPLRFTKECYYKKCKFCDKNNLDKNSLSIISPIDIFKEMQFLRNNYNISTFKFIDDSLPAKHILNLSKLLIDHNCKFQWQGSIRFDNIFNSKNYFNQLCKSGCNKLFLGLETYSESLLKKMNKGIKIENILPILKNMKEAGIKASISLLFNFPGETINDVEKTINFIKSNSKFIDFVETNNFILTKGSILYKEYYNKFNCNNSTKNYFLESPKSYNINTQKQILIKNFNIWLKENNKINLHYKR